MRKKLYFILLVFFFRQANALPVSSGDSVIFHLNQVKGLSPSDSVNILNASRLLFVTNADSIQYDLIADKLNDLIPMIGLKNYLSLKVVLAESYDYSNNYDKAIEYGKSLITELRKNSNDYSKDLLLTALADMRFPFRNSIRIYDGIDYFQHLANDFANSGDANAASVCYYNLAGFHRTLGLVDKAIYYNLKSASFLNSHEVVRAKNFIIGKYINVGIQGLLNRKAVIGGFLNDSDEPLKALPYLYEAKNIFDYIKDSVEVTDGPYVFLQLARSKILSGRDSALFYLGMFRNHFDTQTDPTYYAMYCQEKSHYFYLNNILDSAEYYIQKAGAIKEQFNLIANTFSGFLLPGYYLALIKEKQNKYGDAIQLLNAECDQLLKLNSRRMVLKEWLLLASIYKTAGDFINATAILEKYNNALQQIIIDENKSRSLSFETEQQINVLNTQRQKQQQEIARQKLIRNWIMGGLIVFILFSIIILFQRNKISKARKRTDELLLNILPEEVAEELKEKGSADAKQFDEVTVMFTDFKGFTQISEKLSAKELVAEIDTCFKAFDNIITTHNIEKIKTIGDSYMCAGGLPVTNTTNAVDVVNAAIEIQKFMQKHLLQRKKENKEPFEIRIGVHTGPVVAGIVGVKKFAYDIWGDTVNIASRMESSGEAGKVNISGSTYELVKEKFSCTHRGKIQAKNKGEIDMYFVEN